MTNPEFVICHRYPFSDRYDLLKTASMKTSDNNILDVTVLDPQVKHPTIFTWFDELKPGEAFILHNDHDPKPLYYQMINERGNVFQWEYLEEGPHWWKVRICKRGTDELGAESVGQIAARDLRKAGVFRKYGIDFCCGGKKTLKEVCSEKGLDLSRVEQELGQASSGAGPRPLSFNEWGLDFLADYIVNTHHAYIRNSLPDIVGYASKVARVHGDHHPELLRIRDLAELVGEELSQHLAKEETILFPYIKELSKAVTTGNTPSRSPFGTIRNPILMMEQEHDEAGKIMEEIRSLSNQYAIPEDACTSYTLLYRMLEEFEGDLHTHVHLENNILFPKAMALERGGDV
jgi:regulator of cell morphogenesis and NO signaling